MSKFTDEELRALGLQLDPEAENGFTQGEEYSGMLESEAARGDTARAWSFDETIAEGHSAEFVSMAGFAFERFEERPSVWRVYPPAGGATVREVRGGGVRKEYGGEVIFVDFEKSGAVALESVNSNRVVVAKYGDGRAVVKELIPANERWHPVKLDSNVAEWLKGLDDPWLEGAVTRKLELEMPWQHFVAVGTFVRMRRREPASSVDLARRLLAGEEPPELNRERDWAANLPAAKLRVLEHMGLTVAEAVLEKLGELESDWDAGESITATELLDVLHLRDDLASAQMLLQAAGSITLDSVLQEIDDRAGVLASSWGEEFDLSGDERLRRAVLSDPDGWWTRMSGAQH